MKKKILLILLAIIIVSTVLTGCTGASTGKDESWNKISEKGEFVLGLDDSFPPMGFRDDNNEIVGFDIDVAKEVCDRLGVKLTLQQIVWETKEQELNTGKIDCIWNGLTITEDRKKELLFSEPYMNNRQVLVVKSDSTLTSLDFAGKKVALQAGSSAADALNAKENFKASLAEVVEFDDNMTALMDLEKGGVDAVLMDEIVANYNIQAKNADYKIIDEELATESYGIGFRKNDTALRDKVQKTLEDMAKDGKLAEISEKWFGKDLTTIAK